MGGANVSHQIRTGEWESRDRQHRRRGQPDGVVTPKVAVLGAGYWGRNIVRVLAGLGALAGVHDPDPATADEAHTRHGGASFATVDDALGDDGVDAIAIAAPAVQHAELSRRALEAGKHVFVEKPLALDVPDAEQLCELAEERGLVLMVGHLLQYHAGYLRLQQMVREGALGTVQYAYSNRLNLGKFRREENILWSFAPHDISMILGLMDSEPASVSAVASAHLSPSVADVTTTHLSFPGGARAHVFVSWLHPFKEQKLVVIGTAGMAVFDDGEPWETKLQVWSAPVDWRDGVPHPVKTSGRPVELVESEPLTDELAHFLDTVRSGGVARTDGREGLRVLRVLRAAQDAAIGVEVDVRG